MHPLLKELKFVRRRVRLLLLVHAAAWTIAAVLAVAGVMAALDYLVHFEDRGIRIMASLTVIATAAVFAYRLLVPALATRLSDVGLALRIEERFPEFRDQLASTVQFLRQRSDDPEAGSSMLRREVIHQTASDIEHVDVTEAIDSRPTIRAGAVAAAVIALVVVAAITIPQALAIAMVRLTAPLGDTAWPKTNHLVIANPVHRLALNDRFEVEVSDADSARLPSEVRIHYRFEGDAAGSERVELMHPQRGMMVASIDGVSRPFQYRAEGGDDDAMPWHDLQVVEPPSVTQLNVMLHYPAYTGWPPAASESQVRAIVGTKVAIAGRTNKPIIEAELTIEGEAPIIGHLGSDGYSFEISLESEPGFVVRKSGIFTFDLVDQEGFHGGKDVRYEIRAIEDRAPTVSFEEPAADIYVTADAVVPVRVLAKDDLAIRRADLHWSRSDESAEAEPAPSELPFYEGPEVVEPSAEGAENGRGEARTLEYRWDLAPLGLKPGSRVTVYASVADYQPVTSKSQPRRLSIITRDELQDRLTERQGAILTELARMLKLQQQSRAQVSGLEIQVDQVGRLNKQDIDHLQQAELTQRQVERGLGHRNEGVPAQIESLLGELTNNKVDSSDVERRLSDVLEEIERLGREHLPVVSRELTAALKSAQGASADNAKENNDAKENKNVAAAIPSSKNQPGQSLTEAGKHQDATIESLEQLLANLTEWDSYRRFHRDLGQLRRDQEELARDTGEQGKSTLTQDVKDLKPQQQADLRKLASRQTDLARGFEKIQQRMEQMAEQLKNSDPLVADTIDDALHAAREKTLAGQMREAGREMEQNQLGQASSAQQQTMRSLDELLDILSNRRERELGRLVKKLREAEQQLDKLRQEQEGLKKKLQQAAKNPNEAEKKRELERLTREQKRLEEEAQRFARSLKRLQADQASKSAGRAGGKMGAAGEAGDQGDGDGAAEQAEAAQQDLEDTQKQLAEQRKKAEADLAHEQVARLQDTVTAQRQQQEKILSETKHYDELARDSGGLRRAQLLSLRDVAHQQRALGTDVGALAQKLSAGAGAFELALKAIERAMTQAAERLDDHDTSEATQGRQRLAIERLAQMLKAFEQGKKKPQNQQAEGKQGGQGGQQGQGGESSASVAELRLIKLMQEAINDRVREISEKHGGDGRSLTLDEQQEYAELSQQQADLADLLLELSKPAPEAIPEDQDLKKLLDPEADRSKAGDEPEEDK